MRSLCDICIHRETTKESEEQSNPLRNRFQRKFQIPLPEQNIGRGQEEATEAEIVKAETVMQGQHGKHYWDAFRRVVNW